jgi:hypothetical protein
MFTEKIWGPGKYRMGSPFISRYDSTIFNIISILDATFCSSGAVAYSFSWLRHAGIDEMISFCMRRYEI